MPMEWQLIASALGAGDINQDGWQDLLIGASFADPFGAENAGRANVAYGPTQPMLDLLARRVVSSGRWRRLPRLRAQPRGRAKRGWHPARSEGDVNGDGIADFAISTSAFYSASTALRPGRATSCSDVQRCLVVS